MALNKKRSLYANDTDGRALEALSKAALIDIVVEFMRCDTDNADIALTADEVSQNNRIKAILAARGDRLLQSTEQIAALAAKIAAAEAHAKAFPFGAQRDARKGADAALMEALNSLGNKR